MPRRMGRRSGALLLGDPATWQPCLRRHVAASRPGDHHRVPPQQQHAPQQQVITIPFRLAFLDGPLTWYCDDGCVYAMVTFAFVDLAVDAMLLTDVLLRLLSLAEPEQRPPARDRWRCCCCAAVAVACQVSSNRHKIVLPSVGLGLGFGLGVPSGRVVACRHDRRHSRSLTLTHGRPALGYLAVYFVASLPLQLMADPESPSTVGSTVHTLVGLCLAAAPLWC